jgi:hypothetical protein
MGLIGFYANSQALWTRDSSRAIAQRDATLLIEVLSDSVHAAAAATVADSPDPLHQSLQLYDPDGNQGARFWWNPADSRVHFGATPSADNGPVVGSMVTVFQVDTFLCGVQVRQLAVRGAESGEVRMIAAAAFQNRARQP